MSTNTMIAIKENSDKPKVTANLLPCRIQHSGSIDPIQPFWNPEDASDGSKTAYFRGRKLKGSAVGLPETYRGVVLERKADELRQDHARGGDDDDDMVPLESVGTMEVTAEFDKVVIWSHEEIPNATADPYVRNLQEWLSVADKINAYDETPAAN
ncbi:hypothetical protein VHEMI10380 [[Torrubiella] hemipterigena]|uniref:Uncharacterized protein n=1 Tax=[Torrubiella] hemipterigena TaxID=1531966 RepID=A0A0A1TS19_9HYPO|nr:hypothetical protein VHEMI10380 [[Torrubiella] hemipterigena]